MSINVFFFLRKSHYLSSSKWYVSIDVHFFLCEFLHVKSKKLAKTLSNIYIDDMPRLQIDGGMCTHMYIYPICHSRGLNIHVFLPLDSLGNPMF